MATNYIDKEGLHTQTVSEIVEELTDGYKSIYGDDINVDSDTPDGQRINIEAQAKADVLDLAKQVYNSFDVDTVIGTAQDRLYKINNMYRKTANYSYLQVDVTVSQPVNLQGLDDDADSSDGTGYTVADNTGNNFILLNSVNLTSAGTYTLEFRAQNVGAVEVAPNTVTNMITVQAGVSSVFNPSKQYITGDNQETDSEFRKRRNKSTAFSGQGFYNSLLSNLLNIPLVTAASVYENTPDNKEIDGEDSDSAVWCIVEGGVDTDIATVIYANKTFGVKMVGNTQASVTRPDGSLFTAKFDRPQSENLYIKMTIKSRKNIIPDTDYIKSQLVKNMSFGIYEEVATSDVVIEVNNIDTDAYVVECTFSNDGKTYSPLGRPSTKDRFFYLIEDNIDITLVRG